MESLILSFEPTFHRIERFLLWHNRYASICAFIFGHGVFYAVAHINLRPVCAVAIIFLLLHIIDYIKRKKVESEMSNISDLTNIFLNSYRFLRETQEKMYTMKLQNRLKYSLCICLICIILSYVGIKMNGFYLSYISMLILFTLPAIVYHKILKKLAKRLAPILEQLDQSMEYKRRTLIDRKDLLVKVKTPGINENVDDDDGNVNNHNVQSANMKLNIKLLNVNGIDSEAESAISNSYSPTRTSFDDSSIDLLSDSSLSAVDDDDDDDIPHLNEIWANVADQFDGKQRIKVKGDQIKIKGYKTKQKSPITDKKYFQSHIHFNNIANDTDLKSFDFLDDYDDES